MALDRWSPAEKELSPQAVPERGNLPADWRLHVDKVNIATQNNLIMPPGAYEVEDSPRARLLQDLKHTQLPPAAANAPAIFDADLIRERNVRTEKVYLK
jgi:hypothetical protein